MRRSFVSWASALLLLLLLIGCGSPPKPAPPAVSAEPSKQPVAGLASEASSSVDVNVAFDQHRGLYVTIKASAKTPDELKTWHLADEAPSAGIELKDVAGVAIPFTIQEGRAALTVTQPSKTTLIASYVLEQKTTKREDAGATIINEARFRITGESLLTLPIAFDKRPFRLSVDIDGKKAQLPLIASSFGVAEAHLHKDLPYTVTGNEIRRTAFIGGGGGYAIFNAPEGHDEVGWIGYSAFDPRPIAAETAVFRSTLRDYFRSADIGPQTLLLAVDERPKGHFRVQRRAQGLLVAVSGNEPFDATLRLACAVELVHAFIGERLWVGDARPGREGQSIWFHEGYARWVAREQLYRVGLLSPDEYATEVNRLLSIVTTSPHAQRSLTELAGDLKTGGVVPLLVARGALHATLVDQRIRAKNPKASLDDVVRKHFKESEERRPRGPVAEESWRGSIAEIVPTEKADFDDMITTTKRTSLPADALGSCFEAKEMMFDVYDPGFDVSASRDAQKIIGVRANGPAAKAGLREGDLVTKIEDDPAESKLKVEIEREGKTTLVAFSPSGGSKKGIGFRRRAALSDEACKKLGLRK